MGNISRITERVRAFVTDHGNGGIPKTPVIPAEAGIQNFKSRSNLNTPWMPKLLLQSLLSFIVTFLFVLPSIAATSPVGATAGQFKVSESGAANYSIAIATPPGTAGMQPSLALSYTSQGGNGILGLGWNLSGLSLVQRCPKTLAQDGVRGGVNLDSNDRFCLDGQRLVAISGVYGADSTEYRTEIESYTKIISYGTAGNGPASFKVWTKSGQIMEYGFSDDSRIEAQGKTSAMLWALNKVSDTVGNYLTVTYTEDNPNGQFYPNRIDYTGNTGAGLAPYNSVQFTYETRPDIAPASYIAGSLIKNTLRMSNIKSFAGATLVREYRPVYDNNTGGTDASLLANLTECAGDGVCLPPTVFGWQRSTGGLQMQGAAWAFPAGSDAISGYQTVEWLAERVLSLADINGDGLADFVYFSGGQVNAMLSNGKGFNPPTQWGSGYGLFLTTTAANLLGDINGDGKADFAYIQDGVAYVALSTGSGFTPAAVWATGISLNPNAYVAAWLADVDGDGKADLIYENGGSTYVLLSNGTGFAPASLWSSGNSIGQSGVGGLISKGAVADVDGDGKADFVYAQGSTVMVRLSTGTSFGAAKAWGGLSSTTQFSGLADVDGDGRADLLFGYPYSSNNDNVQVALSNGDAFVASASLGASYGVFSAVSTNRLGDIDGDGRADLFYANYSAPNFNLTRVPTPTQLTTITNGLGTVTTITYKPLTDNTAYTKDNDAVYPVQDIQNQGPMYVVASSSTSNGIGGNYVLNYQYAGMKASQDGRGLLGFRSIDTTDPQTNIVTHNEYRQDYPYIGLPSLSTKKINGTLLNQAQNTYSANPLGGTRYAVQLTQSIESSYELTGGLVTTVTTDTYYDAYGNPTIIGMDTGDGYSKTTLNQYSNNATNWLLGRLTRATVYHNKPGSAGQSRTSSFAYNATNGLLTQEVIEPNNVALRLQTDYTYDGYGNKLSVAVSGSGIITRTTSTIFDARGQFPTKTTNALGHSDTGTYDARFGKALTLTGPNALTTTWAYDGFGRKINETRADATQSNVAYNLCDATCPNFAKYYITSTTLGSPISYAYFDLLNREIRVQTQGFDGRLITKDTYYDSFGRVDRVTKPYYAGDSPLYSYLQYDALGRAIQETAPDNSTKQIIYNGLVTTVTNALNQTETKTKNSQGQLVSVTDNLGNVISYQYDPFGNLTKTTDPKGNQTTLTYDARGRKIGMVDPDMGSWTYTYNVLGELIQQKDAKNQIVNMTYDLLGRMRTRSEPDLISSWDYDEQIKGIGKLTRSYADNGAYKSYSYDSLGRVISEFNIIDATYRVSKTYDPYGRVATLTYPTGVAVKNIYNAYGYLSEVRNNATNALFWKANTKDADGHVLNETLGNGLTTIRTYTNSTGRVQAITTSGAATIQNQSFSFDTLGNLSARFDSVAGFTETFGYDNLNRLITATQGGITTTVTYDSIGNITNKSNVGTYTYGAKPHAVTQVTGTLNASYTYDNNGNLTSGAGRTVTLTSYNLPSQITQGANSVNFIYDADHTRIKQTTASGTTIYLNPRIDAGLHFEKEVKGGITEYKHYIYGASGVVGVYTTSSAASPKTSYFHQDHLGSIVAVTNDSGSVIARYAFDPWGKRLVLAGSADATHHGFTGHEHLDEVGLVHMNGRVYDPVLGRFMSADPYIKYPHNTQGYNRYSYTDNNPLSRVDLDGYGWLSKTWKKIWNNPVVRVVAAIAIAPYAYAYVGLLSGSAFAASVAGGFVAGGIIGGDLKSAVTGAVTAGLFYGAGELGGAAGGIQKIASHAAAGCLGSVVGGGSCKNGALSAGFAEFAGPRIPDIQGIGNVVKYAVLGGGATALGGGKFENGAMTGAFGYLYNYCAHLTAGCAFEWMLNGAKIIGGAVQTGAGVLLCGTGPGCLAGAPVAVIGASIVIDGATYFHNENIAGFNPVKQAAQSTALSLGGTEKMGAAVYHASEVVTGFAALTAPVSATTTFTSMGTRNATGRIYGEITYGSTKFEQAGAAALTINIGSGASKTYNTLQPSSQ